jgi:hypothetical protein
MMKLIRYAGKLAAVAGCASGIVAAALTPAGAATSAPAAVPGGLVPTSTSWISPESGIVLSYTSWNTGAKPYLFVTANGGRTWRTLDAPPLRWPNDNDRPDLTWADGTIVADDGTHVVATHDDGLRWSAVRLAGEPADSFIDQIVNSGGRVFVLVQTQHSGGNQTEQVYSGLLKSATLSQVRGLSVSGPLAYGDITAAGTLQVVLGDNYATERYWYSRDGVHFVSADVPCPVNGMQYLGGVRDGQVTALCTGEPGEVQPGVETIQVWIAPRLGARFHASGQMVDAADGQGFAAASPEDMAEVTNFNIGVTLNAGRTWAAKVTLSSGAFWADLAFQSATTGVADGVTVNSKLKIVGYLYRTTNAGRSWGAMSLP